MKRLHRSGVCALALMSGIAVMQFEPAVLRDFTVEMGADRLSLGAVKAPFWSVALAQDSGTFSVEGVKFTWGAFTYEANRVEFTGVSVTRRDIETLFSPGPEPYAERLARISAKQVHIPELKVTQKIGQKTETILYRNVAMSDIVGGRIASMIIETTAIEESGGPRNTAISYGRSTVSDLNMPAFAKLYETKDASAPLGKVYGAFSIDKIDVLNNTDKSSIQIASIGGKDLMARPTKDSWAGTLSVIQDLADKDTMTGEEQSRLLHAVADILGAFDAGLIEANGITFKAYGQENSATGSIARMVYTGAVGSQPAETRLEGLAFADKDARIKIGAISLAGFSFAPTLSGLKSLEGKSLAGLDHAAMRSLIPTLGTLRITDLDIDAPATEDKPDERVRMTMGLMEVTADKPINGIPTNIRFEQRGVSTTLPKDSDDELAQNLQALGYKSIDGSFAVAATWNEATKEVAIKEFSMDGKDMGSLRLTGLIGSVSPDIFSTDEATAAAALIGVKAKSARVELENRGLLDRYLAMAAKEEGTTPKALQKMYAGATPLVLSSMLGSSEQAKTIGSAIAGFIEKPGKLTIEAEPKNPSGFGMMDVMLASDPKLALEKLKITAKAE